MFRLFWGRESHFVSPLQVLYGKGVDRSRLLEQYGNPDFTRLHDIYSKCIQAC